MKLYPNCRFNLSSPLPPLFPLLSSLLTLPHVFLSFTLLQCDDSILKYIAFNNLFQQIRLNEDQFWRNYFYRVSLLKQAQANSLKGCKSGYGSSSSSEAEGPDDVSPTSEQVDAFQDESQVEIDSTLKQMGITRNDTQADGE